MTRDDCKYSRELSVGNFVRESLHRPNAFGCSPHPAAIWKVELIRIRNTSKRDHLGIERGLISGCRHVLTFGNDDAFGNIGDQEILQRLAKSARALSRVVRNLDHYFASLSVVS